MVKVTGIFILFFVAISFYANAQMIQGQYAFAKEIRFFGSVVDSINKEPLSGAVVHLVTKTLNGEFHTRSLITDKNGKFDFKTENFCQTRAEISFLGYKLRAFVLPKYQETFNLGKILMVSDPFNLDEVTVKTRRKMYERLGDTVRIYSSAVKTMQGDVVIEILRQIPGIEINADGSISMDGKLIERTYINNKLIFGDDNVTALYTMDAKDATNIDIYEEEVAEDQTSLKKRKRKIMNIHAVKDFDEYTAADILLEGGQDRGKNKDGNYENRYSIGGNIGFFNERRQAKMVAEKSNIKVGNSYIGSVSRYNNVLYNITPSEILTLKAELKLKKNDNDYKFYYSFVEYETPSLYEINNVFFPTDYFKSQSIKMMNTSVQNTDNHEIKIGYLYNAVPGFNLDFNTSLSFGVNKNSVNDISETIRDDSVIARTNSLSGVRLNKTSIDGGIKISYKWNKRSVLSISNQTKYNKSEGKESRNYEILNTELDNHIALEVERSDPKLNTHTVLSYSLMLDTTRQYYITFETGMTYEKNKTSNIAINKNTGIVDNLYSVDHQANISKMFFGVFLELRRWDFSINYINTTLKQDENIPVPETIRKTFHTIFPSLNVRILSNRTAGVNYSATLGFDASQVIPAINDLTNILDVSNPMLMRSGNTDLNPSRDYKIKVSTCINNSKLSFNTYTELKYNCDGIIFQRRYFKENTVLPEYENYEAPAGATLTRPINGNNHLILTTSYALETLIASFGKLNTKLSYTFRNPQSEVENKLGRTRKHTGTLMFELATNFSRNIRGSVKNSISYLYNKNSSNNIDEGIKNKTIVNIRLDFLNRFNLETAYIADYSKMSLLDVQENNHVLNVTLGCRVFKERKGMFSINAFDILNKNADFTSAVYDQYVINRWNRVITSYYTLSFEYRFNTQK